MITYVAPGEILAERFGLTIPSEQTDHLAYCLRAAYRDLGFTDLESYLSALRESSPTHPTWQRLLYHLTLGETYFFRDCGSLRNIVLPRLIARRREDHSYRLRVWSAGCATGEEPYTLAILLNLLIPDIARWTVSVVGTDINLAALDTARRGVYSAWSIRSEIHAEPYLALRNKHWHVSDALRRMVTFRYLNLADPRHNDELDIEESDLIVCRNVLLYMDKERRRQITARLRTALAIGGEMMIEDKVYQNVPPRRTAAAVKAKAVKQPDIFGTLNQAYEAANQSHFDEAHHWLDQAEAENWQAAPPHYLRALVYENQKRPQDAMQSLRRCLYLDHNFALAHFMLGNLHAQRGEVSEARRHWRNATKLLNKQPSADKLPFADGMTVSDMLVTLDAQLGESRR